MKEFFPSIRALFRVLWAMRGIFLGLAVLVAIGAVVVARYEGLSLGTAVYFAMITALSVGYGDVAPVTPLGRLAAVGIAICGSLVFGLLIAAATRAVTIVVPHGD